MLFAIALVGDLEQRFLDFEIKIGLLLEVESVPPARLGPFTVLRKSALRFPDPKGPVSYKSVFGGRPRCSVLGSLGVESKVLVAFQHNQIRFGVIEHVA